MNNQKLLLFDFDGVIADSMKLVRLFYNRLHKKYDLPYANTNRDISKIFRKNVYDGLIDIGLKKNEAGNFLNDMKKLTFENENMYKPFNGIKDTLNKLYEKNYSLAIISSNHTEIIERFLDKYTFNNIFKKINGAEKTTSKVTKIRSTRKQLGFNDNQTYYIGDTVGDIKEGKEAGVHTVAVSWGYHTKEELKMANPEFIFDAPEKLTEL